MDTEATSQWFSFHLFKEYFLHFSYLGEVRFGPAYVQVKSRPPIPFLNDKVFGERRQAYDGYLFVELWHSTSVPDLTLIAIDFQAGVVSKVCDIQGDYLTWSVVRVENSTVEITLLNEITRAQETRRYPLKHIESFAPPASPDVAGSDQ